MQRSWVLPAILALLGCEQGSDRPIQDAAADAVISADSAPRRPEDAVSDSVPSADLTEFHVRVLEFGSGGVGATARRGGHLDPPVSESLIVGPCTFIQPAPWDFCDPACVPPEQCRSDGSCTMPKEPLGAGDITVTGLTVGLVLSPETRYQYYQPEFDPEPTDGDLFEEGAIIEATATGGNVPPFAVSVTGIAALQTDLPCPPGLDSDSDLVVTWEPSVGGGTIRFRMASSNHGNHYSSILCEASDTGELTVDHSLVAAWLSGWHPVDSWSLERSQRGSIDLPPYRVVLTASHSVGCSW